MPHAALADAVQSRTQDRSTAVPRRIPGTAAPARRSAHKTSFSTFPRLPMAVPRAVGFWTTTERSATPAFGGASFSARLPGGSGCNPGLHFFSALRSSHAGVGPWQIRGFYTSAGFWRSAAHFAGFPRFLTAVDTTKLEAFKDRGRHDFLASADLEDVVTVVDGRRELLDEVMATGESLRKYLAEEFRPLLENADFVEALPAHLPGDRASQARLPGLRNKLRRLASES
jgi:hypothetical protein